jgi:hypothetical protein
MLQLVLPAVVVELRSLEVVSEAYALELELELEPEEVLVILGGPANTACIAVSH